MSPILLLAAHLALSFPSPAGRLHAVAPSRIRVLLLLASGAGLTAFLVLGRLSVAVAALVAAGTAGWYVRGIRARRRTHRRETVVAAFLGHLAGELRAGRDMPRAVEQATTNLPVDSPPELARLLDRVAAHARRGASGARLLADGSGAVPELAGLGQLWSLAERHGLPLAPLVEQAQLRIDTRLRHRTATSATLQGPQATAVILTLLPAAGIAMGTAMGADPAGFLLGGGAGGLLLVTGTALASAGFVWSRHIIGRAAP